MAGERIVINGSAMFIDYADGEGSAIVNGRKWRWEFHRYCGPTFLDKDGNEVKRLPGEKHPVWDAFGKWLAAWHKANPEVRRKGRKRKPILLDMDAKKEEFTNPANRDSGGC